MNLDKIIIVLTRPDECRNIGSACRAMANNGITHLRIVGKKEDYDTEKVHILAIHAAYIYDNAEFFDSITDATKDCAIAAGTTRRRGKKRKEKLYLPEEIAETIDRITGTAEEENGGKAGAIKRALKLTKLFERKKSRAMEASESGQKAAIVFGNERTGLTDEEFEECTVGVTIPSCEDFPSLNLSHAVQIMSYHLFRQKNSHITGYTPLSLDRLEKTVQTIAESLKKIGFFKVTGRKDMEMFWRSVLSRSALSEGEAQYIEKVFTKAAGLVSKNKAPEEAE